MTMQPLSLPPGTDRQLWTMTLGALLAMRGEDDSMSGVMLDEVRDGTAGAGPLLLAFSTALAVQIAQHHPDAVERVREHLLELAAEEDG